MEEFFAIGILLVLALCVCGVIYVLTTTLGPKNPLPAKLAPYECGALPEGSPRAPFKIQFYAIAVMFLLFDVEAAFFLPWALVYKQSLGQGPELLIAMVLYLGLMVLALLYVIRKGMLHIRGG